jgi:hypothetical protein
MKATSNGTGKTNGIEPVRAFHSQYASQVRPVEVSHKLCSHKSNYNIHPMVDMTWLSCGHILIGFDGFCHDTEHQAGHKKMMNMMGTSEL